MTAIPGSKDMSVVLVVCSSHADEQTFSTRSRAMADLSRAELTNISGSGNVTSTASSVAVAGFSAAGA